jgi:CheY-like chemotaxis protein
MENNRRRRILLIDDDVFIIRLLSLILTKSEYDITTASNGKEAMAILSGQSVDMIIVDMMMPEMDGLAFLGWLRQEARLTIPTLVLTAMVSPDTEKQVLAAGATGLIYKPVKPSDLLSKIKQLEQLI